MKEQQEKKPYQKPSWRKEAMLERFSAKCSKHSGARKKTCGCAPSQNQ
jgi:hypothetical protein